MRIIAKTPAAVATGTATKTLVQMDSGATNTLKPMQLEISFDGVSPTAVPIQVQLLRTTTAGTSTSLPLVHASQLESATIAATAGYNHTVEPTPGDVLRGWLIHPQAGGLIYTFPEPDKYETAKGGRLSVRVVSPAATVNVQVTLECEE